MDTKQTQHTPGPWKAETFVVMGAEDHPKSGYTIKAGDDAIADLYHGCGWTKAEVKANARLIAAAPELLAALEAVLSQIDPKDTPVGLGNILNARAAIAKAKGAQ